ncbi:MAG: nucleoside hydrolase [Microgenomates group bacterium]
MIIISLGPLTDIVNFVKNPLIKKNISEIWIMGGAINVEGNTECPKKNEKAKFNFLMNPYAANIVIKSNLPIFLIPLDITNRFPASSKKIYNNNVFNNKTNFIHKFWASLLDELANDKKNYLWDLITAVIATDKKLATFKPMSINISSCGKIISTGGGNTNVYVAEKVKEEKVYKKIINLILKN